MRELDRIRTALTAASKRQEAAMLVTVLGVDGSVYRGAGARMVVHADGQTVGAVSGGCLEADIGARSPDVLAGGRPEIARYDTRASDDVVLGLGLGCQGVIDLLLEPLGGESLTLAIAFYERLAAHREPVELLTVVAESAHDLSLGSRAVRAEDGSLLEGDARITTLEAGVAREIVKPALQLVICGGGSDAIPVSRLARLMGWNVTVIDHRASFASPDRFPDADTVMQAHAADDPSGVVQRVTLDHNTVAVVMAHSATHDRAYLHLMLEADARYIGVLGPRRRTIELLGERFNGELPANVHSPIGLDIGAETPEEIALAIVSEIAAATAGRTGGLLRDRTGPIHDRNRFGTPVPDAEAEKTTR